VRREVALETVLPGSELLDRLGRVGQNREAIERASAKVMNILHETSSLRAIVADVTPEEFNEIFLGEALNDYPNPLERIVPQATRLALYALTLGEGINNAIEELFKKKNYLLGYLLDQAASLAAERAVKSLESNLDDLMERDKDVRGLAVLSYSPGYCGWHVSGQKKMFRFLRPEEIGIELHEGLLMKPLKSVTGVLVAATPALHCYKADYVFCRQCRDRTCQIRMKCLVSPVFP
jgi:hypothetical protein